MNKHQRSWLAFANSKVCRHANAIHDKGFINWGMKDNFHFSVGDIIYLFVSNERRVMFQMEVIVENRAISQCGQSYQCKLNFVKD